MNYVIGILLFIIIVGVLIFVHEFGHFIAAKFLGIGVTEFSIGLGPKLFSWVKNGTRYSLRLLLFGGYCQMLGQEAAFENQDGITSDEDSSFAKKSVMVRITVILAGPLMNVVLAFVLSLLTVAMAGVSTSNVKVTADSPLYGITSETIEINSLNGSSVATFDDIREFMASSDGSDIEIRYTENGEEMTVTVKPAVTDTGYVLGVISNEYRNDLSIGEVLRYGAHAFWHNGTAVIKAIVGLFTGKTTFSSLTGPVGMAETVTGVVTDVVEGTDAVGDTAYWLLVNMLYMMSILSVNVGLINLFPFPGLDGGRLILLVIEAIRKKSLEKKHEAIVTIIGFLFLAILIIAIFAKDVIHIFIK